MPFYETEEVATGHGESKFTSEMGSEFRVSQVRNLVFDYSPAGWSLEQGRIRKQIQKRFWRKKQQLCNSNCWKTLVCSQVNSCAHIQPKRASLCFSLLGSTSSKFVLRLYPAISSHWVTGFLRLVKVLLTSKIIRISSSIWWPSPSQDTRVDI